MFNIALDGPSGSGKSTIAKALAEKLNILYLDTGAMYRATALFALEKGVEEFSEQSISKILDDLNLKILYENGSQITMLGDEDVSKRIRENRVSMLASKISALKCVRIKMVEMQRETAKNVSCVLDGRDIGTFVLPNAKFKFFITADAVVRAKRRFVELQQRGETVDFDTLLEEIKLRDYNDTHRDFAPLKQAEDSHFIDTSNLTVDEVVDMVLNIVEGK